MWSDPESLAGNYCGCGYVKAGATRLCDSYCSFPCAGNSSEACGADNYASVYNISTQPLSKRDQNYADELPSLEEDQDPHSLGYLRQDQDLDTLPFLSAKLRRRQPRQKAGLVEWLRGEGNPFVL